eukprot:Sspe_Gene.106514::Locus_84587_Transcript_1_1_Confidence_1.000_Length_1493::g.106514::m.106514
MTPTLRTSHTWAVPTPEYTTYTEQNLPRAVRVRCSWYTICQGERVLITDGNGRSTYVDGPARPFLWGCTVQPLMLITANQSECIHVVTRNGDKVSVVGPKSLWFDPLAHIEMSVVTPENLMCGEAVVYRRVSEKVERRIIHGPAQHIPEVNEWTHTFSWHGCPPGSSDSSVKVSGALKFTKLRTIPDKLYFNVKDVRTSDDAKLVFKLMVFYELVDIELMLDRSRDPIADIINAVTADAVDYTSRFSFEEFKNRTSTYNSLETYPQLVERASQVGYTITKVVFRGYEAPTNIQSMHDRSIEQRTRLSLERETEQQAQELADFRQAKEAERSEKVRAEELKTAQHNELLKDAEATAARKRELEEQADKLQILKNQNAESLEYIRGLGDLGVDLTSYLVSKEQGTPGALYSFQGSLPKQVLHMPSK